MSVSAALLRASRVFDSAATVLENAGHGIVKIGPRYIRTLPALERFAVAHHKRGEQGGPVPSFTKPEPEAEPLALWDGVLRSVI